MRNYDLWLENQAEQNYCSPEVIETEYEYEGDGEYSVNNIMNCHGCDETECEYWEEYNN